MKSKINIILAEIEKKREELKHEYFKLMDRYGFTIKGGKIVFNTDAIIKNKKQRKSIWETIFTAQIRELISMPFIYIMIIPAIFLDFMLFMYQQTAFRLYRIPIVKRSQYMINDRKSLDYLNFIQKINCMYCSYFNGLMSYAVEVAGRTERYWCPIKHAKKMSGGHPWQKYFSDYGDPEGFKETFSNPDKVKDYYK
ncbi:MAG: hypothetical protein Q8K30_00430 [Candidatus Gracilibacteria bacterium]|nr:hypothetical protein [Candidatus Gracilibacteria bacterium]